MKTTVEILEGAKTRLIEKGWRQGDAGGPAGPNCLGGALYWTNELNGEVPATVAYTLACDILRQKLQTSVVAYNDALGRTFNEIMAVLDAAILQAKAATA